MFEEVLELLVKYAFIMWQLVGSLLLKALSYIILVVDRRSQTIFTCQKYLLDEMRPVFAAPICQDPLLVKGIDSKDIDTVNLQTDRAILCAIMY